MRFRALSSELIGAPGDSVFDGLKHEHALKYLIINQTIKK
jgi:hypothetical protein